MKPDQILKVLTDYKPASESDPRDPYIIKYVALISVGHAPKKTYKVYFPMKEK